MIIIVILMRYRHPSGIGRGERSTRSPQSDGVGKNVKRTPRTLIISDSFDKPVKLIVPQGSEKANGLSKTYDYIVEETGKISGDFLYVKWSEINGLTALSSFKDDIFRPLDSEGATAKRFLRDVRKATEDDTKVREFVNENSELRVLLDKKDS